MVYTTSNTLCISDQRVQKLQGHKDVKGVNIFLRFNIYRAQVQVVNNSPCMYYIYFTLLPACIAFNLPCSLHVLNLIYPAHCMY